MFEKTIKQTPSHGAKTDIGRKYTSNEDFYILAQPDDRYGVSKKDIKEKGHLYVLCDGMGGAKSGEVASELTAGWVVRGFYETMAKGLDVIETLGQVISGVNTKIFDLAQEHEQYRGMCTTLLAVHIHKNALSICTVGDSRAYLFRQGELTQLTHDQSEIWSLYASGSITKEELRGHPRNHILIRAMGSERILDVGDIGTYEDHLLPSDVLLLCSDGLSDMVSDGDIQTVLAGPDSLDGKANALVTLANDNGGKDNITVVLIGM